MTVGPLAKTAGPVTVQCEGHRLVTILVAAQFLPVPCDQQQGVVGAGPEDKDRQDACALCVDGEAALGQLVDNRLSDGQCQSGGDHREQPQHWAAVGDQQDEDDDGQGGVQQLAVDAREGCRGVRGIASRAGEVHRQTSRARLRDGSHVLHRRGQLVPASTSRVDRHRDLERLVVLGWDRTHGVTINRLDRVELRDLRGQASFPTSAIRSALIEGLPATDC